jgi:TonB family protein
LFDDDGNPLGDGVFEEWWAAKDKWKQTYTGKHFTGATYRSPEGMAHDGTIPWPEELIADAIVSPIADHFDKSLTPVPLTIARTASPLNCIQISSKERARNSQTSPYAYCFDDGTAVLRIRTVRYATATYTRTGLFQERFVGTDTSLQVDHRVAAKVHVETLVSQPGMGRDAITPTRPIKFDPLPADDKRKTTPPRLIAAVEPEFRNLPESQRADGLVVVRTTVSQDGKVTDLHVLESPSLGSGELAVKAIRQYRFKPAQLEKQPMATEVNIEINFRH